MRALGDVDVNFEPGTDQRTHIILNLYFNLKKYDTSFYKIGNYIALILSLNNDKKNKKSSCAIKYLPWRQRPQKLDSDGEADERGHAAVRDGRSEIDGDFVATIVDLQIKVDFKELFNRKIFRSFVKKNGLFL